MRTLSACFLFCLGLATSAAAQQPATPPSQGPLVLEPLSNGVIVAPEVKFTKVDGKVGTLAGAYAGWLYDDHLLVGGGGYWLADNKRNGRDLAYGGAVIGWIAAPDKPVGVTVRTLVGVGQFSDSGTFTVTPPYPIRSDGRIPVDPIPDAHFRFHYDFFVVEPEVDLLLNVSRHVRVTAGAGYRGVQGVRGINSVAGGATGSLSVQFNLGK